MDIPDLHPPWLTMGLFSLNASDGIIPHFFRFFSLGDHARDPHPPRHQSGAPCGRGALHAGPAAPVVKGGASKPVVQRGEKCR